MSRRTIDNRVGWALTYLSQAGLVARPSRGIVQITDVGQAALAANPTRVDMRTLEDHPSYREFKGRTRKDSPGAPAAASAAEVSRATPSELVEQAVSANRAVIEGEVLKSALALSPTGFEDLVIRLLERMGYTTSRFSAGAREEAERINARIELIDGARLAELLVEYGVGVQAQDTITLYRLDEDFFESL